MFQDVLLGIALSLYFLALVVCIAVILTDDGRHEKLNASLTSLMRIISIPSVIMMVFAAIYCMIVGDWQG